MPGKSQKRKDREAMKRGEPLSGEEFDLMLVLADTIEATPPGQRSARMKALLSRVRAVVPAS